MKFLSAALALLVGTIAAEEDHCDHLLETEKAGFHCRPAPEDVPSQSFEIKIGDLETDLAILSVMVRAGETIELEILGNTAFQTNPTAGVVTTNERKLEWKVPDKPGRQCLTISGPDDTVTNLHAWVKTPWDQESKLGEYAIGKYVEANPKRPKKKIPLPDGFVKLGDESQHTLLTPHLRAEQFVSKQANSAPHFILFDHKLLIKLETIIEVITERGHKAEDLLIFSGFRTPAYNQSIGNKTVTSQHLYGTAADICIDADRDWQLDDLDGDGTSTNADVHELVKILEEAENRLPEELHGGMGFYEMKDHRTGFVHTDVRGVKVRWGFPGN